MAKGSAIGGVTEERVRELIAEGIKGLANGDQVKILIIETEEGLRKEIAEKMTALLTAEQAVVLIKDGLKTVPDESRVIELVEEVCFGEPGSETKDLQLDPDWLEGLTFTSSKRIPVSDGRDLHEVVALPLTAADVLSFRLTDRHVHLVAADGRHHIVTR